ELRQALKEQRDENATLRGALVDAATREKRLIDEKETEIKRVIELARESTSVVLLKAQIEQERRDSNAQVEANKREYESTTQRWDKALEKAGKALDTLATGYASRMTGTSVFRTPEAKEPISVLMQILQDEKLCDVISKTVGRDRWIATT